MKTGDKQAVQQEYPFDFSVVMAVYNVEPFLREAVDSLIEQDHGFERIQLIMVDDGSTDGSGAICDEYAARYPENVMVIHKGNGGVSSARNEGLKYATGRFLNFMDSDDKLTENVCSVVHEFYLAHEEETDVVVIPMFYFDGAEGPHIQNNRKFSRGSRVIDLIREWQTVQMSCATAFIKAEAAAEICFDQELAYCEDGKEMQKLLLRKMTLGVVEGASYLYRRRTQGTLSAIQNSYDNPAWYTPYLKGFTESTISLCQERLGYVPKFIQYTLMYDLQWRLRLEEIPDGVMTQEEVAAYKSLLFSLLQYFDDDVIMAQRDTQIEHKAFALKKKYGRDADILWGHHDAVLHYQNTFLCHLNTNKARLDFITMTEDRLCVEGDVILVGENYGDVQVYLEVNGQSIPCTATTWGQNRLSLGEPICLTYGFAGQVPLDPAMEEYEISLYCTVNGRRIDREKLVFGKHCPISAEYENAYYFRDGRVLTTNGSTLHIQKCGRRGRAKRERAYRKELWKGNRLGARKAVLARSLTAPLRPFTRKKIWIISDRINKADDNGEAFFRYVTDRAPKNVKAYFAVSPESPDHRRLKKVGKVIPFLGWRYKLLYLLADCVISSQAEEYIFHPFQEYSGLYRDLAQSQRFVFLQHGVTKDDLSGWLHRFNKNIAMFVTTTVPEYHSIMEYDYYYSENVVKLTGFPRYDRLYDQKDRMITIMPTWRAHLVTGIDPETGKRELKPGFHASRYFAMYDKLLNSRRLFDTAEKLGYTVAFLNHPNMTSAVDEMTGEGRLKLLEVETSYRDIFARSDLVVTDYSSVAFDFAYLRKPVVYFQADKDEFFSGAHTYEKGYFDYEKDGFGEVEYSAEALVDRIIEYMENDCRLKEKYQARIDATFPFSDKENCRRVYEAILEMEDKL